MQPEDYMEMALAEARQAELMDEVPIGAIVVYHGKVIGAGHNMRERFQNAAYHAEMLAIMEACEYLGSWRLEECDLYVTLEPCHYELTNSYFILWSQKSQSRHGRESVSPAERFKIQSSS